MSDFTNPHVVMPAEDTLAEDADPRSRLCLPLVGDCFAEAERILAPGGILAVYVSDSFEKRRAPGDTFVGIGAEFYCMLRTRLQPVDHIAVVRGNTKLDNPEYHAAAQEGNFFLRGFNHLLIFRKP